MDGKIKPKDERQNDTAANDRLFRRADLKDDILMDGLIRRADEKQFGLARSRMWSSLPSKP
jgi:hypothetical protein